ncbi:hypothetical protein FRB95_014758 [Tulasnella sp. JGI-2019a]|nr:hypothetical protein FRB95_014758 [Tulasnella sp. JGI-2019a]
MPTMGFSPSALFSKTFLLTTFMLGLMVQVPLWIFIELKKENRPRASWDLKRSMFVRLFKHAGEKLGYELGLGIGGNHRDPRDQPSEADQKEAQHVWIKPFPMEHIRGEIRDYVERAEVEPAKIGGYWYGRRGGRGEAPPPPGEDEKVIMHYHGGAYVMGTAHPEDITAAISRGVIDHLGPTITRVFSLDYRVSSAPPYPLDSPFPAALIDALAGYKHLLDFGFKPHNIIIMGDSAGGNLALATARYLVEEPVDGMPPPGALLLLSPWCDVTASHENSGDTASSLKNHHSDYLVNPNIELAQWALRAFLGPMGVDEATRNRFIAPGSLNLDPEKVPGMFAGFPRTYIVSGTAERILDEIRVTQQRMVEDLNCDEGKGPDGKLMRSRRADGTFPWVTYDEVPDALHDFLMFPWHQPEVNQTFRRIDAWIQSLPA